jgi:N-acetylglutamate synthase-like GNAT family acetyltransferase
MAAMKIVSYTPDRKADFIRLNTWWIERYFGAVEPRDQAEFDRIDQELAQGGMIFFALDEQGHALATCMARNEGEGVWELAKLGSDPCLPHPGAGTAIFEAAEAWTTAHGARRIYILTNSSLHAAIHIYESHGFRRFDLPQPEFGYARGDYALEKFPET